MDKIQEFLDCLTLAFEREIIKKLVFSRPLASEVKKVVGREVAHRGSRLLALEYHLPGDTVSHKNVKSEELSEVIRALVPEYQQVNLITTEGEVEYKVSRSGKVALLGKDKLMRKMSGESLGFVRAIEALDNKKQYILSGREDFLIKLGVSDESGRVHDKKQGKFRQINRFLEHIEDVYGELGEGEILIYDLCCGKSYLSFAVYYYLKVVKARDVKLVGIDLKRDVIDWCNNLAHTLGYSGMTFIYDDVRNTPRDRVPSMVISLHACDVATDIVINSAIELGARVILSTPCCHRYMNDRISEDCLRFVTRFPHLRNKLCEVLTDSVRLLRLEKNGYKVAALELTDPDDTPKNTLIRAVYRGGNTDAATLEYDRVLEFILGDGKDDYLKGF